MRILHTSDWHLGKNLEGRSRLPEQEKFLNELVDIVQRENINLILLAGDVFDSYNPPAAAEELFFDALDNLAEGGKRAIVIIAGNHDQPERLTASQPLATSHGISILGRPNECLSTSKIIQGKNKVQRIQTAKSLVELYIPGCSASAIIAALPYVSEERLGSVLTQDFNESSIKRTYADRVRCVFNELAQFYRPDTINLAMGHLYVSGGEESDSERQIGGVYSISSTDLPSGAQYIALGHLHRPQKVNRIENIQYSGSPLSYSFSEANQTKSVVLIDVEPLKDPNITLIPLSSGRPLIKWVSNRIDEVLHWCETNRDANAWIDLELHLEQTINFSDIAEIRKRHSGILHIRTLIPNNLDETKKIRRQDVTLEELFCEFYKKKKKGIDPPDELVKLFLEIANSERAE